MIATAKSSRSKNRAFLSGLDDLVNSLPSQSEKDRIVESCGAIADFVKDLQESILALPTVEDTAKVRAAIRELERLYEKAETSPTLAAAVGLNGRRAARRKEAAVGPDDVQQAKDQLNRLESLPVDEIQAKLTGREFRVRQLRSLASLVGLRPGRGVNKEALAHQIAMKIANYRGYRLLRGEGRQK